MNQGVVLIALVALASQVLITAGKDFTECDIFKYVKGKGTSTPKTWTCIAYHESRYKSGAKGDGNADGSYDHGLWQINDNYWCAGDKPGLSNGCGKSCSDFRDDNLDDDWNCVMTVYGRHGFAGWVTYKYCNNAENEGWGNSC